MTIIVELGILIITVLICVVTYFKWKYSYWRTKNVPYIEPQVPFGSLDSPFATKGSTTVTSQEYYRHFKSLGHKYGGLYFFTRPTLLAVDIEFIKNVLLKDFQYFVDRGTYFNEQDDPLSANVLHLGGNKWRNLRAKLTPTFTTKKIKLMFQTLFECGGPLYIAMDEFQQKKEPIDIKDVLEKFTVDVIGSCAFGLQCNSFKDPESDFRRYGKMVFYSSSKIQAIKFIIASSNHALGRRLGLTNTLLEPKHFFLEVVKNTVAYRIANNIARLDFLQLLMDLKNDINTDESFTTEQIAAQAFVFFIASFETSSTAMTFCLYELAINQAIQDKVRHEIRNILAKHDGNTTYDALMEMIYLSQVIDETLRKYPPATALTRANVQDYQIPNTAVTLEKGTLVTIPIYALHHDPEYFPDPEKFDPERFSDKNRSNITPFTYIPFGDGPRNCIGLRFGLLQIKVALVVLLKDFKFLLNSKTQTPIKFDRRNLILTAVNGIWLDAEKVL